MRHDKHTFDKINAERTRNRILREIAKSGVSINTVETLLGCTLSNRNLDLASYGLNSRFIRSILDTVKAKAELAQPTNPLQEEVDSDEDASDSEDSTV